LFTGGGSGGLRPANDEEDSVTKSGFLAAEFEKTSSTYWMPWFWHLFHELVQTQPGVEVLFYLYLAHRFVVEQGQSVLLACWTWME
jgi:hypothetical protein